MFSLIYSSITKIKSAVKNTLLCFALYLFPKFWHKRRCHNEIFDDFEPLGLGEDIIDRFFIILEISELKDGMRVLNIGDLQGKLSCFVKKNGCASTVIGFSRSSIGEFKEDYEGIEFVNVNALNFLPRHKFNRIFIIEFLGQVRKDFLAALFKKYYDWLEEDGCLVVHTIEKQHNRGLNLLNLESINLRELRILFEKSNFTISNMIILPRFSPGYSGGIFCKATKKNTICNDFKGVKVLIDYSANLGDVLCLTGVIREYKEKHLNERLFVKSNHPELFFYSKYVEYAYGEEVYNKFVKVFRIDYHALPERRSKHIVDNLAEQMGISIAAVERKPDIFIKDYEVRIFERRFILSKSKRVIIISPYSSWKTKNWVEQRWREVGQYLINKYDVSLIQVGQMNEPYLGVGSNWIGITDVRSLAILLSKSVAFLSVDNGVHHLAAAVNTPGIVLCGPVGSKYIVHHGITYPINADFGCRGCFHKIDWHPDRPPHFCPIGTYECMKNISTSQVIHAIDDLMNKRR